MKLENAKNWLWPLLNGLLAVAVLLGLVGLKTLWRYGASLPPARTISVSAEGKTTVIPDIATLSFSVVTEGKDPEKVVTENTQKMNVALDVIKKEGLDSKDIKTTNYMNMMKKGGIALSAVIL